MTKRSNEREISNRNPKAIILKTRKKVLFSFCFSCLFYAFKFCQDLQDVKQNHSK